MMAVSEILEIAYSSMAPVWIELSFLVFFALGFALLRGDAIRFLTGSKKGQKAVAVDKWAPASAGPAFDAKLRKTLEAEAAAGHAEAVLKAWRVGQAAAPTPKEQLKSVVQAFLEVEPAALVKEVIGHIRRYPNVFANTVTAVTILDTVARSGNLSVLMELWDALPQKLGMTYAGCMYDVVLGGFASKGLPAKVGQFESRMAKDNLKLSARGYSLIIKGYLKNGLVDEVLKRLVAMKRSGYEPPNFAVAQFLRISAEAGRTVEMFAAASKQSLDMSPEAFAVVLEDCARSSNLELAQQVEKAARAAESPLPVGLYDSLIKLYTVTCHTRAFEIFKEIQDLEVGVSEGLCVGLLARCAESKFLSFAEEIARFCRSKGNMTMSVYSSLMKVYAYSGLYNKACDLYEQIREDGVEPDAMMYGCLMKFAVECGRTEMLRELSEKVPHLDIQHYMSLIRSAGQNRDVDRAFAVFKRLQASTLTPDVAAYNCVLDVCVKAGDMRRARSLVKEMRQLGMVDIITYNTLIKGLCRQGDLKGAMAVLSEIEAAGMKPNDVSYNSLINSAVSSANIREAWQIVDKMEQNNVAPDHYTISIMMKALKKVKAGRDVTRCFDLLDRSGIDPCSDEILLNTVLETCIRHKELKRLEAFLKQYEGCRLRPSMPTYGSIIKAFSTLRRPEKCWHFWNEMQGQRGLQPTHIVVGCMLDALVVNGMVDEAVDLFEKCNVSPPNMVLYSILLKGFANTHQPKRAMDLWREMRANGMKMNTVAYNSILDAQARVGNIEEVSEILKVMAEEGSQPDSITHSVIVKAYCVKGDLDMAIGTIRGMQECQLEHDAVVYNTLLDACSKHRRLDLVEQLLEDMQKHKIAPTNFTLGILVKTYARQKQLRKAFDAMERLSKRGHFQPNQQVWTCLMCACLNNDEPDKAMQVLKDMQAAGHHADGKAYHALVSGLVRTGNFHQAVEVVDEVYGLSSGSNRRRRAAEEPSSLDVDCLEALFAGLSQHGLRQELGVPLLERFRAAELPVSGRIMALAFQAACSKAGDRKGSRRSSAPA